MDFRKATEVLTEAVTAADIAKAVKRSEQSVRQARMAPDRDGYRAPPPGWEAGVAKLARARAERLLRLAEQLEGNA
jgi:hypothetical protein